MHTRTTFQPCSIERRCGRPARRRARASAPAVVTFAASLSFGASAVAIAGPTGGVVTQGQGTISAPGKGQTLVNQSSQQLQLNWNTFNVAANESVRFNQPSSTAIAFNRILDQNPSQIFGTISANGQVVLVNPNGVLIGRTAQLNVNSLVVSSLNAIDFDALSGRYRFSATRTDPGAVINQGTITAGPGGSVTLLGGTVSNSGTIVADYGTVNLAAGRTATLDLAGDGLLRLEVGSDLLTNHDGVVSAVENSGAIQANGGQVFLTASAVKGVFQNLVNNTGVIRANRIESSGGTIELVGPGGTVVSSGTLDASAGDAVSTGGTVELQGDHVGLLDNAVVNVSGATGGGTALIGGDNHGANPEVLDASVTYVSPGATINADAGEEGNGGRIVVWANDFTGYHGGLSAQGGVVGGNGGSAEVSGEQQLQFDGTANLTAPHGTWGSLLLDPNSIVIDGSTTPPSGWPPSSPFVYTASGTTNIGVSLVTSLLQSSSLTLKASGTGSTITESTTAGNTAGPIDVSSTSATPGTAGNSLTLIGDAGITLNYPVTTNNGAISLTSANGNVFLASGATLNAGSANVTISAGTAATVATIQAAGGVNVSSGNSASATAGSGNDLTVGSITSTGNVVLAANNGGSIVQNGTGIVISGGTGSVSLIADGTIGQITNFATHAGTPVTVQDASSLTANVTGTGTNGQINLLVKTPNTATTLAANAIRFSNATSGAILLQAPGNLDTTNTAQYAAGAIGVPTGTSEVGLVSTGGTLTVANGLGILSATPKTLLLAGSDIVNSNATHQFTFNLGSSGDLLFSASNPAADVTLDTTVGNVTATLSNARNLTVSNTGALTVDTATSNGGTVTVDTDTGHNLDVNGQITGTTVTLNAGGAITEDTNQPISAGTLIATAGTSIGALGNSLLTQVTTELEPTSQSGGTYIAQSSAATTPIQLVGSAAGGPLNVDSSNSLSVTSASGAGVQLNVTGANNTLTVSTNPISLGSGNLTLEATGTGGNVALNAPVSAPGIVTIAAGVNGNGAFTFGGVTVTGSEVDIDSKAIGAIGASQLQTQTQTLNATSTAGDINILDTSTSSTTLSASAAGGAVNVQKPQGALNVSSASGNSVTLATAGDGHNLTVASGGTVSATGSNGNVSLATSGNNSNIVMGGALSAGTGGIAIETAGSGNITLNNTVTTTGAVSVTAVGANTGITLNSTVSASGSVTVDAGTAVQPGAITAGAGSSVGGSQVSLAGASIGQLGTALGTAATSSLSATSFNGSIYLQQSGGTSLTASATGGSVNVGATASNGTLSVVSARGNGVSLSTTGISPVLAVNGTVDGEGSAVILDSTGAITLNTPINTAGAVTLNASGAITAGAGDSITTAGNLTLTGASIDATGPALSTSVGTLRASSNNGNININNTGALALTGNSGTGNLDITTTGALTVSSVSGNQVTLQGTSIGGAGGAPASTSATSLKVTSTGGNIAVHQASDLNLTAAATGGSVNVSTGGALTVSSATGAGVTLGSGSATQNLAVNGNLDGGGSAVSLTSADGISVNTSINTASPLTFLASGAITTGAGAVITASSLTVNAGSIGSSSTSRLATAVGSLNTTTAGATFITQSGDVSVQAAAGGALDVQTGNGSITETSATGDGIRLVANGAGKNLTVGTSLNGNTGDITLEAAGDGGGVSLGGSVVTSGNVTIAAGSVNASGALTVTNGASVTGNQVSLSGTSIGGVGVGNQLQLAATSLNAMSTGGGIFVNNSRALTLDASALGGDLDVTNSGAIAVAHASSTGNVSLIAMGAVTGIPGASVTGGLVTLQGSSIGLSSTAPLTTAATSVNATSTNGGIFIQQANGLSLTASASGGPVNVATTSGALTVVSATGNGVTLASGAANQDFNINGTVNGGAGPVSLTATGVGSSITLSGALNTSNDVSLTATGAGGAINLDAPVTTTGGDVTLTASGAGGAVNVNATINATTNVTLAANGGAITAGNGTMITANNLSATGASIGTGAVPLNTTAGLINATSTNGATYINNSGPLTLTASATGGLLDVTTAGALTVTSAVGSDVMLTATGGALTEGAGGNIQGNQITLQAASIGAGNALLNTSGSSLSATSTNGGIFVQQGSALNLVANAGGGPVDVATTNGALTVLSAIGNGVTLSSGGGTSQTLNVNGAVDGQGSTISLRSSGAIEVNTSINTASALVLNAAGSINAAPGDQIAVNSLTATGTSIGSSGGPLVTAVGSLETASTAGGTFVTNTGPLALNATATGGPLDVMTAGALTVTSAVGSDVTLTATGGALMEAAGGNIQGNQITLEAASIGSGNALLNTSGSSLSATSTNGGIFVQQGGALNLVANAVGGPVDVATTNGALTVASVLGNGVSLVAGGASHDLTLNGALDGQGSGVSLMSGGAIVFNSAINTASPLMLSAAGAITADTGDVITAGSLTASGTNIGTSARPLNTSVASLTTTSTNGGIYVNEADSVTLTANATGGPVDVQTANGSLTVNAAVGPTISLTAGGAGSGIALSGAVNAGTGDVTLVAGASGSRGGISAGAGNQVTAGTLSAQGASIGSGAAPLNTAVKTLTANATTGDVDINQQGSIKLASVQAGGNVAIAASSGDITVGAVTARNNATLTASAGTITNGGDANSELTGSTVTLSARAIGAPSTLSGTTLNFAPRLNTDATNLVATSSAGGVYINQLAGLASANVHASGGNNGNIELLTESGDLNIAGMSASGTLLLSAGGNIYALPGAGTISAQSAELRAGGADSRAGHIGTLGHPLVLQLNAGHTLRMFVPQTVNANDANSGPATLTSPGVSSTLSLFVAPSLLAVEDGFGQFQGLGETQFTSPAELLVRSIQNQTATVQTVVGLDWSSFDPNVSLFGKLDPSVCLPGDQRDEEPGALGAADHCAAK